jgi:hypothetical protein
MKHTLCIARVTEDGRTYFTATYDGGITICPQRDTYAEILPALDRVVAQSKVLRVTLWDGKTEVDLPGVPRELPPVEVPHVNF